MSIVSTPTIELHVTGPRGEEGFLVHAPSNEELAWDLENEVVSTRRLWLSDREVWWIAASYLEPVVVIVLRSFSSVLVRGESEDRLLSRDGIPALQGRLF